MQLPEEKSATDKAAKTVPTSRPALMSWLDEVEERICNPIDPRELEQRVVEALRDIYDPELPVNIYDLGLIYRVEASDDGVVEVDMTLTTPGCPVAQTFPGEVESRVRGVEGVTAAAVELVWDPPWTVELLTDETKLELGIL